MVLSFLVFSAICEITYIAVLDFIVTTAVLTHAVGVCFH